MSYLTAQTAKRDKATAEAEQFRALLWAMAVQLQPGEELTVGHADWCGPAAQTHTWAHFQEAGEREPAVRVELGHVGPNAMLVVGLRYQRNNNIIRTGLKKATPTGALQLARSYAAGEKQRQAAERTARQVRADVKTLVEEALGFQTHDGYPMAARLASGFERCMPARLTDGTLVVNIKVERTLTLPEALQLRAVLQTMGGQ